MATGNVWTRHRAVPRFVPGVALLLVGLYQLGAASGRLAPLVDTRRQATEEVLAEAREAAALGIQVGAGIEANQRRLEAAKGDPAETQRLRAEIAAEQKELARRIAVHKRTLDQREADRAASRLASRRAAGFSGVLFALVGVATLVRAYRPARQAPPA